MTAKAGGQPGIANPVVGKSVTSRAVARRRCSPARALQEDPDQDGAKYGPHRYFDVWKRLVAANIPGEEEVMTETRWGFESIGHPWTGNSGL